MVNLKFLPIFLTFAFILIFSGCTVTIPSIWSISNKVLPDYKIIDKEDINKIDRWRNITVHFSDGDSLKGRYLGTNNIIFDNTNIKFTDETNKKTKCVQIKQYGEKKLIPIDSIVKINLWTRRPKVFVGFIGGLIVDLLILNAISQYPVIVPN